MYFIENGPGYFLFYNLFMLDLKKKVLGNTRFRYIRENIASFDFRICTYKKDLLKIVYFECTVIPYVATFCCVTK